MPWDPSDENEPRNAAAIRTAILLGAEFFLDVSGQWQIKGIVMRSKNKTMPAWMFLSTHGLGIDKDGVPRQFKDILHANEQTGLRANRGSDPDSAD